jgi:hypothetical protein
MQQGSGGLPMVMSSLKEVLGVATNQEGFDIRSALRCSRLRPIRRILPYRLPMRQIQELRAIVVAP